MTLFVNFFSMGGYGSYIWSAYLLGGAVLGLHLVWNRIRRVRLKRRLTQYVLRQQP